MVVQLYQILEIFFSGQIKEELEAQSDILRDLANLDKKETQEIAELLGSSHLWELLTFVSIAIFTGLMVAAQPCSRLPFGIPINERPSVLRSKT